MGLVTHLNLKNFRNYADYRLDSAAQFVVLHGNNGVGKTNILEAVSLLSPGRGMRGAKAEHLLKQGAGSWAISANCLIDDENRQVGTGIEPDKANRIVYLDGLKQPSQRVLENLLPMIWLTPRMDRLFQESASDRRRFIDRLAYTFFPGHVVAVKHYEKALSERNRLIKKRIHNPDWFTLLENQLVEQAERIRTTRQKALDLLAEHPNIGTFPAVTLSFKGDYSNLPSTEATSYFINYLKNNRFEVAQIGPHRDDLEAIHQEKQTIAPLCSTGEQKAILISILLSQARALKQYHNRPPLLLLDEVAAHLAPDKRARLYEELDNIGGQAWLTGTDKRYFDDIKDNSLAYKIGE